MPDEKIINPDVFYILKWDNGIHIGFPVNRTNLYRVLPVFDGEEIKILQEVKVDE